MDTSQQDILSAFPHRLNPHAERTRRHVADWVRRTGLVHRESAWRRFQRADFGWFAAAVYPTADASRLDLMADWFAWLFLVDDQLDDGGVGRDPARALRIADQLCAVLSGHRPSDPPSPDTPTAVSALADLWERTAPLGHPGWHRRFAGHLETCLRTAAVWEVGHRVHGTVPSEEAYVVNRRHTGAIYVCMDLIEIAVDVSVPDTLYTGAEFTSALDHACNVVCWTNDVYSLAKERSRGEVHNLVFLVQHHRGWGRSAALDHVHAAIQEETDRFLRAEARLLTTHPHRAGQLAPCLTGMRTWMRGNLDWSRHTQRYARTVDGDTERPDEYLEARLMEAGGWKPDCSRGSVVDGGGHDVADTFA
ncbi:terpene synthase family protein [Streptomyces sp. NPDC002814]